MYDISDKTNAIRQAQLFLLELNYTDRRYPHVAIDGIYGEETQNAVRVFQRYNRLPITGEIDYATWTLLFEQFLLNSERRRSESFIVSEENLPLNVGSSGSDVEIIQAIINRLSKKYNTLPSTQVNGIYSYATSNSVRELQRIYRLSQTGVLDRQILNYIFSDFYESEKRKA